MNIQIKTFFLLISCLIFTLMGLVFYEIVALYKTTVKLSLIEKQQYEMTMKADELRQSSDDLTRMARTYVITKEQKYKDAYYRILDIRDGKAPRPKDYEGIYWDLSKDERLKRHPDEKNISLESQMRALPYSAFEFAKLKEAKQNSDKLAQLEESVLDKNITNVLEYDRATLLLHSPKYHHYKEQIMLPIDEFLASLKERTHKEIVEVRKEIENIYFRMGVLFLLGIVITFASFFIIYRKILKPVKYMYDVIARFREGKKDILQKQFYKDEIGRMIEQFFLMKAKIEQDTEVLKHLAAVDPLTQVYNRRSFFELAQKYFLLAKREHSSFALLMVDIDFFKKINDTYGHIAGDKVLQQLVEILQKSLRESDILARYGGEEFVVLLPNITKEDGLHVANKLCETVRNTPFDIEQTHIEITVSIGLTIFQTDDNSIKETLSRADEALYEAKESGRNRVVVL